MSSFRWGKNARVHVSTTTRLQILAPKLKRICDFLRISDVHKIDRETLFETPTSNDQTNFSIVIAQSSVYPMMANSISQFRVRCFNQDR